MPTLQLLLILLTLSNLAYSRPSTSVESDPETSSTVKHRSRARGAAPIVDLDYSQYQGSYDSNFDLNVFLGIRYAAPPKRWRLPEEPVVNKTSVILATGQPPRCPQSVNGGSNPTDFQSSTLGTEDCLFLNVLAPPNATKLPIFFWIHGGGYGQGAASTFNTSYLQQTSGNGFISVVIQYRLGAFGFLSSADLVKQGGIPNAALHDMRLALRWVKKYISRFGGDPDQVTIGGGSAGGGSVMLMTMANGGEESTSLFRRGIVSSPYLPTQPHYDDELPTNYYLDFAQRAGCLGNDNTASDSAAVYKCLENADTLVLQNASAYTSANAKFGQWAFIPVTDGQLIRELPTQQLLHGKVNGDRLLAGNNANEGNFFVRQNIKNQQNFTDFIQYNYPQLSPENLTSVLSLYAPDITYLTTLSFSNTTTKFETNGLNPPYATELSGYAAGWQQAANNLYAETTFICPAYWLADAYSPRPLPYVLPPNGTASRASWRYQFSTPAAYHGSDMTPLLRDPAVSDANWDGAFRRGFQGIWGNFIATGNPTLSEGSVAGSASSGSSAGNETEEGGGETALAAAGKDVWWAWGRAVGENAERKAGQWWDLLNLNATRINSNGTGGLVRADWSVADGESWEGGRGRRCDLWAELGSVVKM